MTAHRHKDGFGFAVVAGGDPASRQRLGQLLRQRGIAPLPVSDPGLRSAVNGAGLPFALHLLPGLGGLLAAARLAPAAHEIILYRRHRAGSAPLATAALAVAAARRDIGLSIRCLPTPGGTPPRIARPLSSHALTGALGPETPLEVRRDCDLLALAALHPACQSLPRTARLRVGGGTSAHHAAPDAPPRARIAKATPLALLSPRPPSAFIRPGDDPGPDLVALHFAARMLSGRPPVATRRPLDLSRRIGGSPEALSWMELLAALECNLPLREDAPPPWRDPGISDWFATRVCAYRPDLRRFATLSGSHPAILKD